MTILVEEMEEGMLMIRLTGIIEVVVPKNDNRTNKYLQNIHIKLKCVKILKFWRTELSYAQSKNRGKKMRLL
jgi:hypothetical protein